MKKLLDTNPEAWEEALYKQPHGGPRGAFLEIFKDIDAPNWIMNDSFQKLSEPLQAVDLVILIEK